MAKRAAALALLGALAAAGLAACGDAERPEEPEPARILHGGAKPRIELSAAAVRSAGIRIATVRRAAAEVVPAGAVVITAHGQTVVFASPAARQYVRTPVRVRSYAGGRAVLAAGPRPGARIVVVGAVELEGVARGVVPEE